jgi:hypothetical protein
MMEPLITKYRGRISVSSILTASNKGYDDLTKFDKFPNGTCSRETFVEVLWEWGCSWLWEHMSIEGGTSWVARAITDGSLVAVTDGSFIKQIYPHLCSAAFILE